MKIKLDTNLLDYSSWVEGTSGNTTGFDQVSNYGTINSREMQTDPFGSNTIVWKSFNITGRTDTSGGWTTTRLPIDITKTYRHSVWVKQVDSSTSKYVYHGLRTFNDAGTQQPTIDISTGASGNNKYTTINTSAVVSGFTQNEWRLYVGYIYPSTWTGTTDNVNTGIYKPDGTKLNWGSGGGSGDLKFSGSSTKLYTILLSPYNISNAPSGMTSYACYPRIDLVDGTEPSITTLLNNEGPWREVTNVKLKHDTNLANYSDWNTNLSGSTYFFSQLSNTTGSYRDIVLDPFSGNSYVWVAYTNSGTTSAGSGIDNSVFMRIDSSKKYRMSYWINKKVDLGTLYSGLRCYNSLSGYTYFKRLSTGANTDYTIAALSSVFTLNQWNLIVSHIHPYTWTGTTNDIQSGIYTGTTIKNTSSVYDAKWVSGITHVGYRIFPYNTLSGLTSRYDIIYPRLDLIDGTEPSIATLLNNEGPWREVTNVKLKHDTNLLNYSNWESGTTGTIGATTQVSEAYKRYTEYTVNGTLNRIVLELDPFGTSVPCWLSSSGSTQTGNIYGGFNMEPSTTNYQYVQVDNTKTYRMSIWMKRKDIGSNTGNLYFGTWSLNSAFSRTNMQSTPVYSLTNNPYQISSSPTQTNVIFPENEWRLCVAHLRPYTTPTGSTLLTDTGVYMTNGVKLTTGFTISDYIMSAATFYTGIRISNPYNIVSGATTKGYSCYPRIDLVDGTEPSITTLLNNEGPWRDG